MIRKRFGEKKFSSRGMYIRSTSDILPKWKDEVRIYRQIGVIYAVLQIYRSYTQFARRKFIMI